MELNIYTSSGILKTTCDPADSDTGVKEIMADNVINLSFILFENIKLEVNDYVDFYGERYYCLEEYFPSQKSTVEWEYRVQFFGIEGLTRRALVLNNTDGDMEADFSLTDTPENHLRLIVNNINRVLNTTVWEVGECVIGENITLDYSGVYCSDGLNNLAQKCETEWWFDGLRLNLSRCEIGNSIELGYAAGLLSLSRQAADNVKFFTRLFPLGSKRNIVPDEYGASRLQLPNSIKYLEQNTQYGIIEHYESAAFEKIYPRRVGTISSVRSETKTGADGKPFTIYYFADKDLNFDPNSYEIAGLVKNIYFDSGELNGRDFEVNFNSTTKEFEIITQYPDENTQLPGGGLVPKAGDKYILYNITMPVEYYTLAETEYMEAALAYMAKNNKDKAVYKAPTDYIELDERGVRLLLGQRVKLISEKYFPQTGYKHSRITRISRKLNNPNEAEIEISDVLGTGKITMITNEITKTTEVVKGVDKRQEVSAKRQNKALTELEDYLLDTEGYFDTAKFKALSIEARMLAVGLQSQNFTLSGIRVTPNSGNLTTVVVTAGTLTHASLEVTGLGSTWAINGKTLSAPDVNKAYYIYAKCSKNTLQGTIEIAEIELKVEQFPNFYVFNLGVLYPQRSGETWRDYSATYGVTSVVGDQIYGGGIKALDGFNFLDLRAAAESGRFRLGSRSKGSIDYGVTEPDTLTLLNTKLVSRGGNSAYAPVYRGAWTNAELYYTGEMVTYNGSMYQCKTDTPTAGIMPVNTQYWDKTVSKGDPGAVDEETLNNINNKIDSIEIGGVNLILNSKQIEIGGTWHASEPLLFSQTLRPGKNYILSVSNMFDGLYFRIYPAGGGWETGVNVPFNTPFTVNTEFAHGIFYTAGDGTVETIKLEEGNKVTAWSAAPEDVQATAEAYALAKANLAETQAKAHADGVVDAEEARAIADATNKANYAREAAIQAAKEFDEAIKVGTRNYIAKQYLIDWNKYNSLITTPGRDSDGIYYSINQGLLYIHVGISTTQDIFRGKIKYRPYTQYTLSVKWKLPAIQSNVGLMIFFYYTDGSSSSISIGQTQTAVVTQNLISVAGKTVARITTSYGAGPYTYIYNIQLTEGNKVVDFIQAQEDITADAVNLIPNSNFVQGTKGYTPNQAVNLEITNGFLHATTTQTSSTPGVRFPVVKLEEGIYTFKINFGRINILKYYINVFKSDLSAIVDGASFDTLPIITDYTAQLAIPEAGEYTLILMWIAINGLSGIDIFNSCLCKGDVNIANYPLAPENLIAQSVEQSAKNLGFTKIENGLIQSSHIQLRQPGGAETAGISGVQTGPAFWSGGSLSQAIAALNDPLANDTTVIGHNGKGVLNNLVIRGAIASYFVRRTVPNYDTIFLKDQFNLCLDTIFSGNATVYLPNDVKYNGIRCLIYNNRSQGWGWIVVKQINNQNYINTSKKALGIEVGYVGCFTAVLTGSSVTWYCENHNDLYNTT